MCHLSGNTSRLVQKPEREMAHRCVRIAAASNSPSQRIRWKGRWFFLAQEKFPQCSFWRLQAECCGHLRSKLAQ